MRTGEWEVVVITVFASQPELDAALAVVAPLVRERVTPLAEGVVERREGSVMVQLFAAAGARHAA